MRFRFTRFSRICFLISAVWSLVLLCSCSASWINEAQSIIALLGPAITSALGILAAFGKGVSAQTLSAIQGWEQQSTEDLATVGSLIQQYQKAEASAQPGILSEIQTALQVGIANLSTLLPELHIDDASTQAKVTAIFQAVAAEWASLVALVPVIKSAVATTTDPHGQLKLIAKSTAFADLKSASEFKTYFNSLAAPFGKQFQIGLDAAVDTTE